MQYSALNISRDHVHKLLCTASGDAALLYLYLQSGNDLAGAAKDLQISEGTVQCAAATLRQLGLWVEKEKVFLVGERPSYSEQDVLGAMDTDKDFKGLYGNVQQVLGRTLTTEELKIILGFVRYLGLPNEVICILVSFCKERIRQKGSNRNPSMRSIEKEAYKWADMGIDTILTNDYHRISQIVKK